MDVLRVEDLHKGGSSGRLLSSLSTGEAEHILGSSYGLSINIKFWVYDL